MRNFKYQDQILKLFKSHHLLSVEDVSKLVKGADYSTVYRNIIRLKDQGNLKEVVLGRHDIKYELADGPNHHHFVCVSCEEVMSLPDSKGNQASLPGARVVDLIIRGYCSRCAN